MLRTAFVAAALLSLFAPACTNDYGAYKYPKRAEPSTDDGDAGSSPDDAGTGDAATDR